MQRVLFGNDGSGTIAFRVSKAGRSVFSGSVDDFLFDEENYNTLPVFTATIGFLPNSEPGTPAPGIPNPTWYYWFYQHNLGFVPMMIATPSTEVTIGVDNTYVQILSESKQSLNYPVSLALFNIPVG